MLFRKDQVGRSYVWELFPLPSQQELVASHLGHILEIPDDQGGYFYFKVKQDQGGHYVLMLPRTPHGARVWTLVEDRYFKAHRLPWKLSGAQKGCLWFYLLAVVLFFAAGASSTGNDWNSGGSDLLAALSFFVVLGATVQFFFYGFWDRDPERGARTAEAIAVASVVHHALTVHEDNQRIERNIVDNDRIEFELREQERAREWETKEAALWETRRRDLVRELRGGGW